jgi:hypothetical protein
MTSDSLTCVDEFLRAVAGGEISSCSAWAPDIELDATVPDWRFLKHGVTAVKEEYAQWFADAGSFLEMSRTEIQGGVLVRYLLTWVEDGVPHVAHHMHELIVVDDKIVRDTVLCGGRWPQPLVDEMHAAQEADDARAY